MAKRSGSKKGTIEDIVISVKATNIDKVTTSLSSLKTILSSVQTSITNINSRLTTLGKGMEEVAGKIAHLTSVTDGGAKTLTKLANTLHKAATAVTTLNDASSKGGIEKLFSGSALGAVMAADVAASMTQLNAQTKATNSTLSALVETSEQTNKYLYIMAAHLESVADASEDTTTEINALNKSLGSTGKHAKQAGDGVSGLARSSGNLARSNSKMMFSAGGLVALYASWAATVYTLAQGLDYLKRSADLSRLEKNLGALARRGQDLRGLSESLREVSAGSLSQEEAIRTATKAVTYGFSSDELEELTMYARKASIALGRDMVESLDRLTLGIAKGEIELLDELGIVTRLDTAYKKYAESVGKTKEQLTETERRAAITTESLAQLEEAYSGINAESTVYEKLLANIKDLSRELGQGIASSDIVTGGASLFNDMADGIKKMVAQQKRFNIALQKSSDLRVAVEKSAKNRQNNELNYQDIDSQLNLLGKAAQAEQEIIDRSLDREAVLARIKKLEADITNMREASRSDPNYISPSYTVGGAMDAYFVQLQNNLASAITEAKQLREVLAELDKDRAASNKELDATMPEVSLMSPEDKEKTRAEYDKRRKASLDAENAYDTAFSKIMVSRSNRYKDLYSSLQASFDSLEGLDGKFSILHQKVAQNFLEVAKSFDLERAFKEAGADPRWLINYVKNQGDLLDEMTHRLGLSSARIGNTLTSAAEQASMLADDYRKYTDQITIRDEATDEQIKRTQEQLDLEANLAASTENLELSLARVNSTYEIRGKYQKDELEQLRLQEEGLQKVIAEQRAAGASSKYLSEQILALKDVQASIDLLNITREETKSMSELNTEYKNCSSSQRRTTLLLVPSCTYRGRG